MKNRIFRLAAAFFRTVTQVHREKATDMLVFEVTEMENIFMILLLGGFIGLPSPPGIFAMELLPHLEEELRVMIARSDMAGDPLGSLMGMLNMD